MPHDLRPSDAQSPTHERLHQAGQAANEAAAQHVFADFRQRKGAHTRRAHDADLRRLSACLRDVAGLDLDAQQLATDPAAWTGMTWGLLQTFVQWQLQRGYAVASINRALSTAKRYAALAFSAGVLDERTYLLMKTVSGYSRKEGRQVDTGREQTRTGHKKADPTPIPAADVLRLKRDHPDTPQGRRDAVLMCLLLDLGLRVGEVAGLTVGDLDLDGGTLTFYRPKVAAVQTHHLLADSLTALRRYVEAGDMPSAQDACLLRSSNKSGALTAGRMSENAIRRRVKRLGERIGLANLSPHDCRHSWATRAARHQTDPFALQEAGGWASLAMPRRYVEAAAIANEGIKLD